ncbi:MAG: M66 family metalloprotease [Gemmatimonadota bacterium]|nr:M66 family metalloprotease [Gemmatimonadota bacterium]
MKQNTVPHRFPATSWVCALAALLALALAAGCGDGGEPVAPPPPPPPAPPRAASIEIVSGDGQRGAAGAALPEPVVVRVADAGGSPVAGATVAFAPGAGGGAADPSEVTSDAQGLARTVWTLGEADAQTLTAAVAGGPSVRLRASLLKPDDLVRALEVVSGNEQRADAGAALPDPVVVRAIDAEGAPVAGATVAFTPQSRGTADPAEVLSDAEGVARTTWTLGAAAGGQTLWAAVRGVSLQITATANNPDRAALGAFYEATGGSGWENNENWLTDAPLGEWYGVTTDTNGRVVEMVLGFNDLSGRIPPDIGRLTSLRQLVIIYNPGLEGSIVPPELAQLANLTWLSLNGNDLSGPIPRELGKMSNLQLLGLTQNRLTGSIPPELGDLPRLGQLYLSQNGLTGEIPPELGNLPLFRLDLKHNQLTGEIPSALTRAGGLEALDLGWNQLAGSIPPELSTLPRLRELSLRENALMGPVPPELGRLRDLEELNLSANALTGNLPAELSRLSALETLDVSNNADMSGALPAELTALRLTTFRLGGTGICVPRDNEFREWLLAIPDPYAPLCAPEGAAAYLTQAVQSLDFPVSQVAGEDALLRAFVTSDNAAGASIPPMRATFYEDGREIYVADVPGQTTAIPAEIDEGNLEASANVTIPGSVIVPGLQMVVEVDPDGTLGAGVDVQKRIPETGRLTVGVRALPTFDLIVVPFLRRSNPDRSIIDIVNALSADDDLFGMTRTLLPVREMAVTAHEPVWTSSTDASGMLRELQLLKLAEGGTGYYLGTTLPAYGGGLAYQLWGVAVSDLEESIVAHELGHTFSLGHAPCGNPRGVDPTYPYSDGSIGAWGYDARAGALVPPDTPELMSYCGSRWISDYHFGKAMGHRLTAESAASVAASSVSPAAGPSLLLWGGANPHGELFLEPAFVVDAPPALPERDGAYRVSGLDARGNELFSLSFGMDEIADGDGSTSFAFSLPAHPDWAGALARIVLTGPNGAVDMDRDGAPAAALLRDPVTGRVRGILRDWATEDLAGAGTISPPPEAGLEVQISRGVPPAAAWRK